MRKTMAMVLLFAAASLVAGVASADRFQSFAGNTVGAPTFHRPDEAGPLTSTDLVHYRTQVFQLLTTSSCTIYSAQDYDGYLHLYRSSFNPASPLTNLVDGDDDAELGVGTSRIPNNLNTDSISLAAGVYILVTSGFSDSSAGSFQNFIQCDGDVQPLHSACYFVGYPREQQVCLQDRFAVKIDQISNHPTDGRGTPVRFGSTDSAFFWFYNDKNFEVMVKVLNGCALNGHWWVFFAGTTNQAFRLQVGDAGSGHVNTYNRFLGPASPAETDTEAFPCP